MLTGLVASLVVRGWAADPVNITVPWSSVLEERDVSIRGLVASRWPVIDRGQAVERSAFEFQVGVEIDLRGLDVRMAEPERDARGVDPGVQERHREGVPIMWNST